MATLRSTSAALALLSLLASAGCADKQAEAATAEAQRLYDQGLALEQRRIGSQDLRDAEVLYMRSVEADSTFVLGHAGLARINAAMIHFMYEPVPARRARARQEAETTLRLDPEGGAAHQAMGTYWYFAEKNYPRAATEFELAAKALPNDADIQASAGYVQRRRGDWDHALEYLQKAAELDPRNPGIRQNLADTYEAFGRIDESLAMWRDVERLVPDGHYDLNRGLVRFRATGASDSLEAALARLPKGFDPDGTVTQIRYDLAWMKRKPAEALSALGASGLKLVQDQNFYRPVPLLAAQAERLAGSGAQARVALDTARFVLETALVAHADDARMHASLGTTFAGLGRSADAVREAERALELMPASRDALIAQSIQRQAAAVLAQAGQRDRAIALLESLFQQRVFGYSRHDLVLDPAWETLRANARFKALTAG